MIMKIIYFVVVVIFAVLCNNAKNDKNVLDLIYYSLGYLSSLMVLFYISTKEIIENNKK